MTEIMSHNASKFNNIELKMLDFTISKATSIRSALIKIDGNNKGFLIVLDNTKKVIGTITDGDIRRSLIGRSNMSDSILFKTPFKYLKDTDGFDRVCELFKSDKINFLPICNHEMLLVNLITKKQFHTLLLHDKVWSLNVDFADLNENEIDFEIYNKPWGFYKSTILSKYVQSKIITVFPGEELSLQEHKRREEHWVVIKGRGKVVLGSSILDAFPGKYIYIPKELKHQIINDGCENIVFAEVQLGDYFGEDDIIRHSDKYGRNNKGK